MLPAVQDGGAVATVRGYRGDGQRGLRMFPTLVRRVAQDRAALDRLRQQAEDGVLTLRVAQTFPPRRRPRRTGCSRAAASAAGWC